MNFELRKDTAAERQPTRAELLEKRSEIISQIAKLQQQLTDGDAQYLNATLSDQEKQARTRAQSSIMIDIAKLQTHRTEIDNTLDTVSPPEATLEETDNRLGNNGDERMAANTIWTDVQKGGNNRAANM
jgi:hypothetical protein